MPEGDTIHRTARTLNLVLAGRAIVRFEAPRLVATGPTAGTVVRAVEARGKHLLVHFDDGRVLHTHMRMSGSWHVYRRGEPWRRGRGAARVVLETADGTVAVCFAAPVVEWLRDPGSRGGAVLAQLGPDLCRADADLDEAARRLARLDPAVEIGTALLDQRVASGVGNVYKSEVCFACRVDPSTPLSLVDTATRHALLDTAARMLRANLDRAHRETTLGGLAVYGRTGRPCRRCGTTIRRRRQGIPARSTYWCPTCQPPA